MHSVSGLELESCFTSPIICGLGNIWAGGTDANESSILTVGSVGNAF